MTGRLPDHLVIGAPKSGTTSLSRWLGAHPDVFVPPQKEIRFFDRDEAWARGVDWYAEQFAGAGAARQVGEATPAYLASPEAAGRIASVLPDARLIAVVRHPVERAYSHYWHARDWGGETRSFEEVVEAQLRGRPEGRPYLVAGHYLEHLNRFEAVFPRESLLVLRFEDLSADPGGTFRRVCEFLGIPLVEPEIVGTVHNAHSRHRSVRLRLFMQRKRLWRRAPFAARLLNRLNTQERGYPPMPTDLRRRLLEHYAGRNADLAAHLGWDLSEWSR